jgi:hypothetical protein
MTGRMTTKPKYSAIIGDIVRDGRACAACQYRINVSTSAVDAHVFVCAHTLDSVTAALDVAGIVYTDRPLTGDRHLVKVNRWANRAALAVR